MILENNIPDILANLDQIKEKIGKEIGVTEVANIQSNTPVLSGTLRRSISYNTKSNKEGLVITVGVDGSFINSNNGAKVEDYANKVEYEDKSYIRNTLKGDENLINSIILKHFKDI